MTEQMADIGDVRMCYETFGESQAKPLLLVMGLGAPMNWWDDAFCHLLVDRGFFVIRYDNRDVGHSSSMSGKASLARSLLTRTAQAYDLRDMAGDAVGLLDHLGIDAAHVVGASMGGMIAQTMAITSPKRVRSLTSIMSTTGNRLVGWPNPRTFRRMFSRKARTREQYVQESLKIWQVLAGGYPVEESRIRRMAGGTYDRGLNPAGYWRQAAATIAAPNRTKQLARMDVPTLVIHGTKDPLIHVSGGKATASAVPNAELMLIPEMGHDMPTAQHADIANAIAHNAARAGHGPSSEEPANDPVRI